MAVTPSQNAPPEGMLFFSSKVAFGFNPLYMFSVKAL
jgi:hypothetical protein